MSLNEQKTEEKQYPKTVVCINRKPATVTLFYTPYPEGLSLTSQKGPMPKSYTFQPGRNDVPGEIFAQIVADEKNLLRMASNQVAVNEEATKMYIQSKMIPDVSKMNAHEASKIIKATFTVSDLKKILDYEQRRTGGSRVSLEKQINKQLSRAEKMDLALRG